MQLHTGVDPEAAACNEKEEEKAVHQLCFFSICAKCPRGQDAQ